MKRISVFGLGYVGCVSAACLAEAGFEVIGIDLNEEKVDMINNGKSPIVEPGLDELLAKVVSEGKLRATTSCEEAVINSDLAFICVGTPGDENGKLRLNALQNVSREIGQVLKGSTKPYTVVVRSTVLPGTTQRIVTSSLLATAGEIFRPFLKVAMNPEFIREGTALKDFANPPFTLVGSEDGDTENVLKEIYKNVDAPYIHTSLKTAEAVKYLCNSYHALKVCFANEAGDICQSLALMHRKSCVFSVWIQNSIFQMLTCALVLHSAVPVCRKISGPCFMQHIMPMLRCRYSNLSCLPMRHKLNRPLPKCWHQGKSASEFWVCHSSLILMI